MSRHPLAGVVEKLRRSDANLTTLYHEVAAYLKEAPYSLYAGPDAGDGNPGFTFHIEREPPLRLSAIVGDVIHNCRSALDYIICELVKLNSGTPTKMTQFPICSTERDFVNEAVHRKRLKGLTPRAFLIVNAVQPYHVEPPKLRLAQLWHLHQLSNLDKHHMLALSAIGADCRLKFTHPDGRQIVSEFENRAIHDGAIIASFPISFLHPKIKTEMKITLSVTFKESPVADFEMLNALQRIREFVGQFLLPAFEPFFDPLPDDLRLVTHGLSPDLPRERPRASGVL